jgi:DNA-binding transcriptional LysR family regulator
MRIDFLGLEAFLNIAELGSFQQAASRLNLSQTALSHRMKKLEEDLGLRLLTRTTRQISLTPAGLDFLPKARQVFDELSRSIDALREEGRRHQEHISIGCLPTIAVSYLPIVLRELADRFPKVSVKVFDNSASEIAEAVRAGTAAFGVTLMSTTAWDIETKPLFKESFVLLCPAGHRLAGAAAVNWSDLEGLPLVRMSLRSGIRNLIDTALGSRREALQWRYEVLHIATAIGMVTSGLALGVLPRRAVDLRGLSPDLVAVVLRNPTVTRSLGIIQKRGLPLTEAEQALQDMIVRDLRGASTRSSRAR